MKFKYEVNMTFLKRNWLRHISHIKEKKSFLCSNNFSTSKGARETNFYSTRLVAKAQY